MSTKKRRKKCESLSKGKEVKKDFKSICDDEGDNLLHLSVLANIDSQTMTNICRFLSEKCDKFGINCRNNLLQTPLHIASCTGNQSLVKVLIDFEADIGLVDRNIENPIHLAVKYGNKNCLEILLNKCRNNSEVLNALNVNGFSPLHLCVNCEVECSQEMIKMIVDSGADINVRDGLSGRTPLMHALISNRKQRNSIKNTLLSLNANISQTDYSGFKAIDVMQENDI